MKSDNKSHSRILTYEQCFNFILEFFNYDKDKAISWYMKKNPLLGDISPFEMIKIGKGRKLMKFITSQLSENSR